MSLLRLLIPDSAMGCSNNLLCDLPETAFHMVCELLEVGDIGALETVSNHLRTLVIDSGVWAQKAKALHRKSKYGLIGQMLHVLSTKKKRTNEMYKTVVGYHIILDQIGIYLQCALQAEKRLLDHLSSAMVTRICVIAAVYDYGHGSVSNWAIDKLNDIRAGHIRVEMVHAKLQQIYTFSEEFKLAHESIYIDCPLNTTGHDLLVNRHRMKKALHMDSTASYEVKKFQEWAYSTLNPSKRQLVNCTKARSAKANKHLAVVLARNGVGVTPRAIEENYWESVD